jgi:hypothetical protein
MPASRLRRLLTVARAYLANEEPPPDDDGQWHYLMTMTSLYADAVGRHGPGSRQAVVVREMYADDPGFAALADALDRIKRNLGGSGIDYPPANP